MAQSTNSSRPSNSPILIGVVVLALAGLIGLNVMANKAAPKSEHEVEAEQKEASSPAATPLPVASAPAASGTPGGLSDPNSLVMMGPGGVVGSQSAKQEVVVGFSWTPAVQSDPSKVSAAVDTLQKSLGNQGHVKVVNVDDQPNVPEGISLGGKLLVPAESNGAISPQAIAIVKQALASAP